MSFNKSILSTVILSSTLLVVSCKKGNGGGEVSHQPNTQNPTAHHTLDTSSSLSQKTPNQEPNLNPSPNDIESTANHLNTGVSSINQENKILPPKTSIKPVENTQNETAPEESKPVENTQNETLPTESKPVENTQNETAPAESKPVENTQNETASAESKPVENTQNETAPAENTQNETAPAESKPVENTESETAPTETKPVENAQNETAPTNNKPVENSAIEMPSEPVLPYNPDQTENTETEKETETENENNISLNLDDKNPLSETTTVNPAYTENMSSSEQKMHKPRVEPLNKHHYENTVQKRIFTNKIGIVDIDFNMKDDLGEAFKFKDGKERLILNKDIYKEAKGNKNSHGTMAAGVIAQKNQNAYIYAYTAGSYDMSAVSASNQHYEAAYDNGVRIFNNSYGNNPWKETVEQKGWKYLTQSNLYQQLADMAEKDSIFVWAAGNDGERRHTGQNEHATVEAHVPVIREEARKGWIVVASVNWRNDALATYSSRIGKYAQNWGIAAHGEWSLFGGKVNTQGTSFATPVVTAAVANVWEKFDWMDHHLVTQTILSTADKLGKQEVTEGPNEYVGWGILNEKRALKGPARFDKRLLTPSNKDYVIAKLDYQYSPNKDNFTWSNDIKGDAGFKKQGTGTLYFTGKNAYEGPTIIENGTLVIGNQLTRSAVQIQSAGTLLAKNLVNPAEKVQINQNVNNAGSLEIYGKGLLIEGNYVTSDQARTVIDIDQAKLEVKGLIDLNHSSIVADVENIQQVPSREAQTKTIIESETGIQNYNGDYAISDRANPYIELSEIKQNNREIIATYKRNETKYVLDMANENSLKTRILAKEMDLILDEVAENNSSLERTALSIINAKPKAVARAVDSLSAEIYPAIYQVTLTSIKEFNQKIANEQFSNNQNQRDYHIYGGVDQSKLEIYQHDQSGLANLKNKGNSQWLGLDKKIDRFILGAGLQHKDQTLSSLSSEKNYVGSADLKQNTLSLYGKYHGEYFYYLAQLGLTKTKGKLDRTLLLPNQNKDIHSNIHLKDYGLYNEFGMNLQNNTLLINPYLAMHMHHLKQKSINEKETFGLHIHQYNQNHYAYELGLRLTQQFFEKLNIHTNLAYLYNKNSMDKMITAEYIGSNVDTQLYGINSPKHELKFNVGLDYRLTDHFNIYASMAYAKLWNKPMKSYYKNAHIGVTYSF